MLDHEKCTGFENGAPRTDIVTGVYLVWRGWEGGGGGLQANDDKR